MQRHAFQHDGLTLSYLATRATITWATSMRCLTASDHHETEHGAVAFFDLQSGLKLAVFARGDLSIDAGITQSPPSTSEFSVGHNVRSQAEVDAVMRQAKDAGAAIIKPAQKIFWGRLRRILSGP